MKKLRICFRILFLISLVIVLIDIISLTEYKYFPYAAMQYRMDSLYLKRDNPYHSYYSANRSDKLFTIPKYEQEALICIDSANMVYKYGYDDIYKHIDPSAFFVSFEPDDHVMAKSISAHTDNLATHDCLFICSLKRATVLNAITICKNSTDGLFHKVRQYIDILYSNISWRYHYLFNRKYVTLDGITVGHRPVIFQFYYFSLLSGQSYLFECLPSYEREWSLYYFPTVLLSGPILDNVEIVLSNSNGILYKCINVSYKKSTYYYSKDGHYIRTVGKCDKDKSAFSFYFSDVADSNSIIKDYFQSI